MNLLYLLKILNTTKLSKLVEMMDMPALDMNLALWEAEDAGDIEIDRAKDKVKALKEAGGTWYNPDLANKLISTIQHYAREEKNVTVGRLNSQIKNPADGQGYRVHEYLMTVQHLIDDGQLLEQTINLPEIKEKRPFQQFIFLALPENEEFNAEWNARVVNNWIAEWEVDKVK